MDQSVRWILILSCIPVFLAAGYALYSYKLLNEKLKVFTWFLTLSFAVQLLSAILWFSSINNMPLLHFYVAAGFCCIAWFYRVLLRGMIEARVLKIAAAGFVIFCAVNVMWFQKLTEYNSYGLTLESVLVIILSLSTMILSKNEIMESTDLSEFKSVNWINAGLFIFYASDILLFYYGDVLMSIFPVYLSRYSYILHSFFSVIMYLCFITAIWKSLKN